MPVRLSNTRPLKSTGSGMLSFHSSEGIQIFGARGRTCEKTKQQRVKPVLEKRAYLGAGYIHLVWAVHLDTMGAPH